MATNPMFNTAVSPNKATAPTNKVNDAKRTFTVGRNTFNYSRPHYLTARYSDITPFECIHGVEGDVLELGSKHSVRSHTLKAPLESKIFMKKSYFQVDMKAILPRNWNRFYINPTVGDDVVASDVNTFVKNFFFPFHYKADTLQAFASQGVQMPSGPRYFDNLMHYVMIYESIFSSGSLLNHFGFHTNAMCKQNFDLMFEDLINDLVFPIFVEYDDLGGGAPQIISFDATQKHQFLSLIRHNHSWRVYYSTQTDFDDSLRALERFFASFRLHQIDEHNTPLNYDCLCAYQIICANFYSRDSVDYVYSAETYRDMMDSLWRSQLSLVSGTLDFSLRDFEYEYNGQYFLYDALSGKILSFILKDILFGNLLDPLVFPNLDFSNFPAYYYFMNLFAYNENLRYGDYFTGSKPRPLAVGDVTAEVSSQGVNAIDMTVALARARFMNDVNRVGRRPEDYIEDITDGVLPPEITEPRFLASVSSRVSGFEVENTAENQGNIVTILKSGDSNKVYSVAIGHPCIILGLVTFDIERVYSRTVDRFFFHEDRFDMFNRYLQRIGDQPILRSELDASYDGPIDGVPYSYTLRHMEYKQRFPIASGGFIDFLPGYLFVTDNLDKIDLEDHVNVNINPSYIRSRDVEMDQFYSSLTNYSLAGYFHFILGFDNICIAHRKMDYTPTIL